MVGKAMSRIDRETPVQVEIVNYLHLALPGAIIHHAKGEVNRGGVTFMREQAKANRKGALKGFPDLIVLPYAHIGPLFFEVKAKGNYADKTQKEVHAKMEALGYRVAVVRSIDDVKKYLTRWAVWAKP
jgi:hypothetical protein